MEEVVHLDCRSLPPNPLELTFYRPGASPIILHVYSSSPTCKAGTRLLREAFLIVIASLERLILLLTTLRAASTSPLLCEGSLLSGLRPLFDKAILVDSLAGF